MSAPGQGWVAYPELVQQPELVALADRMFGDGTPPGPQQLFLAVTMACCAVLPEQQLGALDGYAATGACVFYAAAADGSAEYRPWLLEVTLGASASYTMQSADGSTVYSESDSEPWQAATLALLGRSAWRVLQGPAGLPA